MCVILFVLCITKKELIEMRSLTKVRRTSMMRASSGSSLKTAAC